MVKGEGVTSATESDDAKLADDNKTVTVTFKSKSFVQGKLYDLSIAAVADITGQKTMAAHGATDAVVKTFAGTGVENKAPEISSVIADDSQVITVKFNQKLPVNRGRIKLGRLNRIYCKECNFE